MATITKNVYRELRERLTSGRLQPGTRLSEVALAKEFKTSRAPVREAIKELVAEGFIEKTVNASSYVRKADRADLVGLFELREWIECGAMLKVVEWIDEGHLAEVEQSCKDLHDLAYFYRDTNKRIGEGELAKRQESIELAFHLTLLRAAGNRRALEIVANQRMLTRTWLIVPTIQDWRNVLRQAREHDEVLRAIRAGDAKAAAEAMRYHIRAGRDSTLAAFDRHQHKLALENKHRQDGGVLRIDLPESAEKNRRYKVTEFDLTDNRKE